MKLTDMTVRTLPVPARGQKDYWDTTFPSFGVRVSQGGTRTFVLMQDGSRKALGRYPIVTLAQARDLARRTLTERVLGLSSISYADALDVFLKTHCKGLRTAKEYERLLRKHFTFTKPLSHITTREIVDILDTLPPVVANNAHARMRTLMRWAKARRYIQHSPCEGLPRPHKSASRDRVLSDEEVKKIWGATGDTQFGTIIKLCLLTGQRRGEVAAIKDEWIAGDILTFPATITKNKKVHSIPVSPRVKILVGALLSYPKRQTAWSKPKVNLDQRAGITGWVIHDLRRTVSTNLGEMNTPPHIIDRILNHTAGTLHRTYNRYQYLAEMRDALEAWEARLLDIVKQ